MPATGTLTRRTPPRRRPSAATSRRRCRPYNRGGAQRRSGRVVYSDVCTDVQPICCFRLAVVQELLVAWRQRKLVLGRRDDAVVDVVVHDGGVGRHRGQDHAGVGRRRRVVVAQLRDFGVHRLQPEGTRTPCATRVPTVSGRLVRSPPRPKPYVSNDSVRFTSTGRKYCHGRCHASRHQRRETLASARQCHAKPRLRRPPVRTVSSSRPRRMQTPNASSGTALRCRNSLAESTSGTARGEPCPSVWERAAQATCWGRRTAAQVDVHLKDGIRVVRQLVAHRRHRLELQCRAKHRQRHGVREHADLASTGTGTGSARAAGQPRPPERRRGPCEGSPARTEGHPLNRALPSIPCRCPAQSPPSPAMPSVPWPASAAPTGRPSAAAAPRRAVPAGARRGPPSPP